MLEDFRVNVYMLDDKNENFQVKSVHGPYICR